MVKGIVLFILKIFLGGIFKSIQNKEAEAARRKADAATIYAGSAEEAKDVEVKILEKQAQVDTLYKDKSLPESDPFGFSAFNKGE